MTRASIEALAALAGNRAALGRSLARHAATNPRIFGSVARGDATNDSDIDIIVDLLPGNGNPLLRLAGISEEFRLILGREVDVVACEVLKEQISKTALADAVPL